MPLNLSGIKYIKILQPRRYDYGRKKANPLIGAFRDSALDIVQPEKKTPELSKTMEPVKAAPDKKTAEAAKPPAVDVKKKPEEAAKPAVETKAAKTAEAAKQPAADVKQKSEAALAQEVEIPKDFKMPINQKASESVTTLPLHEIKSFEGHPFSVKDDKDMQELVESVKRFGILEPVVVIEPFPQKRTKKQMKKRNKIKKSKVD